MIWNKISSKLASQEHTPWLLAVIFLISLAVCVLITGVPLVNYAVEREKNAFNADENYFYVNSERLQLRAGLAADLAALQDGLVSSLAEAVKDPTERNLELAFMKMVDFEKVGQLQLMEFVRNDGTVFLSSVEGRIDSNVREWPLVAGTTDFSRSNAYAVVDNRLFAVATTIVRYDGDKIGTFVTGLEIDNNRIKDWYHTDTKKIHIFSGETVFASTFDGVTKSKEIGTIPDSETKIVSVGGDSYFARSIRVPAFVVEKGRLTEVVITYAVGLTEFYASLWSIGKVALVFLVPCILLFGVLIFSLSNRITRSNRVLSSFNTKLEERVAERTMTVMNQQRILEQQSKMSALGEMAGGIAHEINNPLAIIGGNAGILRAKIEKSFKDHPDSQSILKTVRKIDDTVTRITKIIRGLKQFSRQDDQDALEPAGLMGLLNEAVSICHERIRSSDVKIEIMNIPESLELWCRPASILQIFVNLIGNAIDAIGVQEKKWILFSAHASSGSDTAVIRITDCGMGIPPDLREKIMQPFFTTKEVGKGTGLGLSICRGIAESHGGKFYIDEKSPHTCFVLEIPAVKSSAGLGGSPKASA